MDLFPKSNKDIFKRRIISQSSNSDLIENPSIKWSLSRFENTKRHHTIDNETALEREMEQTLGQVNSFMHRLQVAALVHDKSRTGKSRDWSKYQQLECYFKDQIVLGHKVMGKVKELLDLEDSGLRLVKSFRSVSNKPSTSDYMHNSIHENESNMSNSSRYSSDLRDVLRKFNHLYNNKDTSMIPHVDGHKTAYKVKTGSGRDSLQFLTDHLANDKIQLTFTALPLKASEPGYTVTCRVFNVTVEGQASEKIAARKAAATKMLERLLEENLKKCLPPQITPLTESEINEAIDILCEIERYEDILAQLCLERRKLPPRYQSTREADKHCVTVCCSALGLQATGTHFNLTMAKRKAAREVLQHFKQRPNY